HSMAARWMAVGQSNDADARRAGHEAVSAALTGPDPRLLVVFCCEGYDLEALVAGARDAAGEVPLVGCSTAGEIAAAGAGGAEVPLVGGCAGDGLRMKRTFQLHGGSVLQHAVVGAAIASDAPMGIGVRHGWRRVGAPMLVTKSEGSRVLTLDDAPALDVYLQ